MVTYPYNRNFRIKILSLCLNPLWMSQYGASIVLPNYFEREDEEQVAAAILEYYTKYGRVPRDSEDVIALCGDEHDELIYDVFDSAYDTDLAVDLVVQFAKEQAAKIAILESIDDVKVGNIQRAIERMESALAVGDNLHFPGIDVVADSDKWLYDLWVNKVPTGWHHVDMLLEGGLGVGELGLIMAPTNRGKSMALINIGLGAAGLGSGKNVVHITHEMSDKVVAKRYAARMTFRFPSRNRSLEAYDDELQKVARRLVPGKIRVLDLGRSSLDGVKANLDRLVAEDYDIGLIIDDYPDLLGVAKDRRYAERRFELSHIYAEFRELGRRYSCPVWAATQSRRSSFSKEIITLEDIAEDIGKAHIADVIIALCQTREEEMADVCRLFMAKVRDGGKHRMFRAKFSGQSQSIVTTGVVREKEKDV